LIEATKKFADALFGRLILTGFDRPFFSPVGSRVDCAGNGKALEFPITSVAEQIIAKENL